MVVPLEDLQVPVDALQQRLNPLSERAFAWAKLGAGPVHHERPRGAGPRMQGQRELPHELAGWNSEQVTDDGVGERRTPAAVGDVIDAARGPVAGRHVVHDQWVCRETPAQIVEGYP